MNLNFTALNAGNAGVSVKVSRDVEAELSVAIHDTVEASLPVESKEQLKTSLSFTAPQKVKAQLLAMLFKGVAYFEITEEGHLIVTMTDGSKVDLGRAIGEDGFSPTVDLIPIDGGIRITVTDKDGTESADILYGMQGDITEHIVLDQADYDALTEKKATTLYLIRG